MNFKVVSTGQRTGNLNEDPKLRIYPDANRFKLNKKACDLLGVQAGDSVTVLADTDEKLLAIHASIPKVNAKGEPMYKEVRMSKEAKEELIANGETVPTELDYQFGCKLGKHYEFASGYTIAEIGTKDAIVCDLQETVKGEEIGVDATNVAIFSYDSEVAAEEEEEEDEQTED